MSTRSIAASVRAPTFRVPAVGRKPISKIAVVKRETLNVHFDPEAFLEESGVGKTIIELAAKGRAFSQGDPAAAVFYIQKGRVKLTVVSHSGKEANIALLGPGEFVGEDCIISAHPTRIATATAITPCTLLRINKAEMVHALHQQHALSDLFVAFLLTRNARIQEDLVDQLFNSSEKRLARILLLLAHFGKPGQPETMIPKISQETLAAMVGTTRSRVSFFMNRFRKLGFIDYNSNSMDVHSSLLNIILHD
ncbi:MAG TPA: Crp/Fnr family transcriptional regulator [Terriglobales bacterium]|nr:Crp/Fnr family transcriptional regulator [Terriglobales bacterium]